MDDPLFRSQAAEIDIVRGWSISRYPGLVFARGAEYTILIIVHNSPNLILFLGTIIYHHAFEWPVQHYAIGMTLEMKTMAFLKKK